MTSLMPIYQLDPSRSLREFAAKTSSPDPEGWRGRKRHRSLTRCEHEGANCGGTGESSNLRGRARRRSTSPVGTRSRTVSRAADVQGEAAASLSPARKRLLRVLVLGRRRRSQSPSRSRSPNTLQQQPPRRRQRTRSRSREHADTSLPPRRPPSLESRQPASSSGLVAGLRQDVLRRQAASNQSQDIQMAE